MSNRTNDLPKLSGIKHLIREMRYHEFSRQSIGIILVSVFCFETSSNSIIPYASNPFRYIALSDIKVLSSRFEGSPNILLETACVALFWLDPVVLPPKPKASHD